MKMIRSRGRSGKIKRRREGARKRNKPLIYSLRHIKLYREKS
jgi:hypothetical protein